MPKKTNLVRKITLTSSLAIFVVLVSWWSVVAEADDKKGTAHHAMHLNHIKTQAEAEALKPGDSIAMACSMCKHVAVHQVTKGKSHVKMMTIGQKHKCAACGGSVTVVGTGKGKGKNEEVKHVCAKCGDNVMFVCATKHGKHHHHKHEKK